MPQITVSRLFIYPVKSLGGIALERSAVTDRGLALDRRWMIVDHDDEFMTQREHPALAAVWVEAADDALILSAMGLDALEVPFKSAGAMRKVRVWNNVVDAVEVSAAASQWVSHLVGAPARLVFMPDVSRRLCNPEYAKSGEITSFADGYPVLITSEASLEDLNIRINTTGLGQPVPMNRFRPNIVVRDVDAWAEDDWKDIAIGSAQFRAVKPCGRCQVTTTDQATGEVKGPEPLATLATFRDSTRFGVMFGQNLTVAQQGMVAIGDTLRVS